MLVRDYHAPATVSLSVIGSGYQWSWTLLQHYAPYLLGGLVGTFEVCALAFLVLIPISLIAAAGRQSRFILIRFPVQLYLDFFRSTPFLVQLVWWYFVLPLFTGYAIGGFEAAVIGLALYMASYEAEVVRAGIISLPRGQTEAALALGMKRGQVYRRVVLPQAIMRMIPSTINVLISLIKESSIVSAVSVTELMFRTNEVASESYRPVEPLTFTGLTYVAIIVPLSILARYAYQHQREHFE